MLKNKELLHFTDLEVWKRGHQLFLDTWKDIQQLSKNLANRIIIDQILRSVGSISANIAEGFNARSTRQYISFLDIAKRATAESENWFYKLKDLGLLGQIIDKRISECIEISKMLSGLMKSLESRDKMRGIR